MKLAPNKQSGFTLIELLVVIAIIGILSATVLASLQDARGAARDSAIKQQVRSYVTTLEIERAQNGALLNHATSWVGNSGTTCATEAYSGSLAEDLRTICTGILSNAAITSTQMLYVGISAPFNDGKTYSVMARLNSGDWYCMSSRGRTYEGPISGWSGSGCYANP